MRQVACIVAAGLLWLAVLGAPCAGAAERRCGWLVNPTPGNWWLLDRAGEWILGTQGGAQADGMDAMPDLSQRQWVVTNPPDYGYGCACLDVEASRGRITRLLQVEQLPLARCRADHSLPAPS